MSRFTTEIASKRWRWFESSRVEIGCDGLFRIPTSPFLPENLPYQKTETIRSRQPLENQRFYVFGNPRPMLDGKGKPYIQLLDAEDMGLIQMRVEWRAFENRGEMQRKPIGTDGTVCVSLSPSMTLAPVAVEKVELRLRSAKGDKVLATAPASTKLPFVAVFSVYLTEVEKNLIIAAFHQRAGILSVRYYTKHQGVAGEAVSTEFFCESDVATWFINGEGVSCISTL